MSRFSRRDFLTTLAAAAATSALTRPSFAEDYGLGQMEMKERYDSVASPIAAATSSSPTFSPYTVQATQNALQKYTELAGQGGWPQVTGKGRLQLGDENDDV